MKATSQGESPPRVISLRDLRLRAVRARIAELASVSAAPEALGVIHLLPHQRRAAAQVARALLRHGGCLLADDVGRGKTYVALAVARQWKRPLVVVPASLRATWQRAMERARVPCAMVTHEALSRGALPSREPDGVIVDESHRFRSPEAKRHAALSRIAAHAPVLLLSATPLQNRTRDLAAQLALFLGSSAFGVSVELLARHVVRSSGGNDETLPAIAPPRWLPCANDDGAVLRAILALPPPARSFDAGDAGALRTIGLVRAWASSRAALTSAMHRRMRVITALEQCAASGLSPGVQDLRAWQGVDGDVQLALAPLLISRTDVDGGSALLDAVAADRAGLDRLAAVVRSSPDPDLARVDALRRLRLVHAEARILVFSEFANTVRAFYALLRADPGVGMLTAREARIASGRLPRDALLERFAPAAQGATDPSPRERVTLLLATDLLSEGMNLQDASVVVHLDLPWNPARLAQRLGRLRRPGGAAVVHSYLMAPPATTELLLRVDARLRSKLSRAERAIGRMLEVMPTLTSSQLEAATPDPFDHPCGAGSGASAEVLGAVSELVMSWRRAGKRSREREPALLSAAVTGSAEGWLAALDDGRLLARVAGCSVNGGAAVAHAVAAAAGDARPCMYEERSRALAELTVHLERERIRSDCGIEGASVPLDALLERRIAAAIRRTPRHRRAAALTLAARLRAELCRTRSLGAERELHEALTTPTLDGTGELEWLERAITLAGRTPTRPASAHAPRIAALIVLGPASAG